MHQSRTTLLAGFAPLLLLMSCGSSPTGPTPPSKPAVLSSAISSTSANNDASTVTYTVAYTGSHQFFRVYLDTDRTATTGFGYSGIGVEFLIENSNIYKYSGSGSDWSWTSAGAVTFTNSATQATWTVARSALGVTDPCAAAANVVFDIDDGTTPVMHQVLSPAATCAASTASTASVAKPAVSVVANGPISGAHATNDATNVQYAFTYTRTPAYWRVYVDTDSAAATGFPAGMGVGAELLLEGGMVYRYVGPGWNWSPAGNATFSASGGAASWSVARTVLGETAACGESSALLFETEDSAGHSSDAGPLAQTFTNAASCGSSGSGGTTQPPATTPPPPTAAGTGGVTGTPAATGGSTATPSATGGSAAPTPAATGGSAPTPVATGGTTPTPVATGGTTPTPVATGGTAPTPPATGGTGGTAAGAHTQVVFVIAFENEAEDAVYGNSSAPYINKTLIPQYAHGTAFTDPLPDSIPSEPHYLWMEAGTNVFSDTTFKDDSDPDASNSTSSTAHLAAQMMAATPAVSWLSFQEGLNSSTGACPISSSGFYGAKHDPFVFFQDIAGRTPSKTASLCVAHHRAYTTSSFAQALSQGAVAQYNFITPNLCNDMHGATGCPSSNVIAAGDAWLSTNLPPIIQYANAHNGVIFVVWDEPEGGSPLIPFLAIGPHVKAGYTSTASITHSALVKTVEKIFGLPLLPTVASANDFGDLFQSGYYP